jgi:anti-sigma regulatory factor (Ser/Thr protein kinase)
MSEDQQDPFLEAPDVLRLANDPASVATARAHVRDVIGSWGATPVHDPGLATSEVLTNAVVHTDGEIRVRVRPVDGRARVEVHDVDPAHPEVQERDPQRIGGWGLRLVESLAACWGVTNIEDDGKIVWFDIDLLPGAAS